MASYIVAGVRTPVGKLLGNLRTVAAPQLGAICVREVLARSGMLPEHVDEVVLGHVLQAGTGQAPARQAALLAGMPPQVPAVTINKVCGSGLKAVMMADQAVRCGDADVVIAGGMENMSRAPHAWLGSRTGHKLGSQEFVDLLLLDGLQCASTGLSMGAYAEDLAREANIDRSAQDAWACESHRRAVLAAVEGRFAAELVPVSFAGRAGEPVVVQRDEGPRADASLATLARLHPAFATDGTVTPGNSSQISDGAAAVVVVSERRASRHPGPWRARIVASAAAGSEPRQLFLAPLAAIDRALARAQLKPQDIDLVEINEAFAVQCLACHQRLDWPDDRINVHGGAIALGHPIGASGARVLVTLLHALHQRQLRRGLVSLCIGGGNAVAMIVELES
ncbi:MAG: acetyl-CoA C-acetyltransferase [Pirellulaceae bacterium]